MAKSKQAKIDALASKISLYEQAATQISKTSHWKGETSLNTTLGELQDWISPRLSEMKNELELLKMAAEKAGK